MGTTYETNVYINDQKKDFIKIKGNSSLKEIRDKCTNTIPSRGYYFISKNGIIKNYEENFNASDILKEEDKKNNLYRLDLKSVEYYENKSFSSIIYINNEKAKIIEINYNSSLKDIRDKSSDIIPKDDNYYFISQNGDIIENEDSALKASDIRKEVMKLINIELI